MLHIARVAGIGIALGLAACGNDASVSGPKPAGTAGSGVAGAGTTVQTSSSVGSGGGNAQTGAGGSVGGAGGSASPTGAAGSGGAQGGAASGAGGMSGISDAAVDGPASDARAGAADADAAGPVLPARVLLYHFSTSDIPTVPAQLAFMKSKLAEWQYQSDDSVDPAKFTDANLSAYGAVAMVNTCFEPFGAGKPDRPQSEALQRFVQNGGGLFGTHCAAVTFQSATPPVLYNQLIGGRGGNGFFDGMSDCRKVADHPSTSLLPATFVFSGNLDNADYVAPDSVVLVRCKWGPPDQRDVAVSWYRTEGKGRVFYTNFGKVDSDWKDPMLGDQHIVPGLSWVLRR